MRPEKISIVGEIRSQTEKTSFVFLADYHRLTVEQFMELRRQLREAGAELHVVKNRLFKLIAAERSWSRLDPALKGPSAMIVGRDAIQAAKVIEKFRTDNKKPALKAGVMGTTYLTPEDITALAALPSREELLASLVGTLAAPLSQLVSVMKQKVSSIVYVLKSIEDNKRA